MLPNAKAHALEGKFRGTYVCEKLPTTRDILRAPLDLVVNGDKVQFARPLFNMNGTRVVGSEMGTGAIDDDGGVHLTSEWGYLGNTARGDYSGTLTPAGGTLTGTQILRGADAANLHRSAGASTQVTCVIAAAMTSMVAPPPALDFSAALWVWGASPRL